MYTRSNRQDEAILMRLHNIPSCSINSKSKHQNISSHVFKISAISPVLRTREITDIFNTFDETDIQLFNIKISK